MWGPDHRMSLSPHDLIKSVQEIRLVEKSIGKGKKKFYHQRKLIEKIKSLIFAKNMKKNEKLKLEHIKIKRPGTGIRPKFINKIIGLRLKNIKLNNLIRLDHLKK